MEAFLGLTLSAPGYQWLRLALRHALHHSGTSKHDRGILRWRDNCNSVQGFRRAFKERINDRIKDYLRTSSVQMVLLIAQRALRCL